MMLTIDIPQTIEGILLITKRPTDMLYSTYRLWRKDHATRLKQRLKKGIPKDGKSKSSEYWGRY